jgi:hypothetical protein
MTFQEAVLKARSLRGAKFGPVPGHSLTEMQWAEFAQEAPHSFIAAVLRDDWDVEQPPMDFATAMKHLQEGKKVRRRSWSNPKFFIRKVWTGSDYDLGAINIDGGNVNATDWEVVD